MKILLINILIIILLYNKKHIKKKIGNNKIKSLYLYKLFILKTKYIVLKT